MKEVKELRKQKLNVNGVRINFSQLNSSDLDLLYSLHLCANEKERGCEVNYKDIFIAGLRKIGKEEIEALKISSLSTQDKLRLKIEQFNLKNKKNLSMDEYLEFKLKL